LRALKTSGGTVISRITDTTPAVTTNRLLAFHAGQSEPSFLATQSQRIEISFTCQAVGQLLAYIRSGGNPYALAISGSYLDLLYQAGADLNFRAEPASALHFWFRVYRGLLSWQTIRAGQDQEASVACRLRVAWDQVNPPIVPTPNQPLSITPPSVNLYTLGPVGVNGALLGGVQDWTLSSNEQPESISSDGDVWATYEAIRSVSPSAAIRAIGVPWRAMGLAGTQITALSLYLMAKQLYGGNYGQASPQHVKIYAAAGRIDPDNARGGETNPAETNLTASLINAGSDFALDYSTAAAITN
jgi:hypothetical protein